uniref:FBD domain-containing protein n=1 Tax=Aegilops tauschii subsp. strangulata TaxID=200361 RepID=A0A453HKC1_AEGTS
REPKEGKGESQRGTRVSGGSCRLLPPITLCRRRAGKLRRASKVTFKRDLQYCPAFSKLKSLLLSDWCLVADLQTLLHFLHYAPVLEKLTLQVCKKPKSDMELEGNDFLEQSLVLKYLKIVEVKCQMIDEQIHNLLKTLSFSSKSLEKINVQKL